MAFVPMTCPNCGEVLYVHDEREIEHVRRDASEHDTASHVILEKEAAGARLLHRCVVDA